MHTLIMHQSGAKSQLGMYVSDAKRQMAFYRKYKHDYDLNSAIENTNVALVIHKFLRKGDQNAHN